MAKYTTELRSICEVYAGYNEPQGLSNINDVISKALPKIFDFTYPIYDESYRNVLETKIVKHFYTREICAETIGRWKLFLNERLNLIMPYYNQRYKSTLLDFNPLYDIDLTTDHNKDNNGNSNNNGTHETNIKNERSYNRQSNGDDWNYYNETPQGGIEGLESGNYLTSATHDTSNDTIKDTDNTTTNDSGNTTDSTKYTDTETYLEHVKGKSAGISFSKMLTEYRKTFINIDNEIIENLDDLFMQVW